MSNEHPTPASAGTTVSPVAHPLAGAATRRTVRRAVRRPGTGSVRHPVARPSARSPRRSAMNAWSPETAEILDGTRLWRQADPEIELTVVVPFYNPGAALRRTVERLVATLRAERVGFEVIAVSDGSTDGSERSLDGVGSEVRVVANRVNQGKGAALHAGFARARGAWVGFVDADGDIDPVHLAEYLRIARTDRPDAVYADKRHAASTSAATRLRKLISTVYSTLVTALFLLGIRDTQTGCKIFRRDVLATVLPKLRERGFAFDLEFFVAARAAGFHDLVAAPVRLEARLAGSSVTSKAILRTIRATFVIFGRRHLQRQYLPAGSRTTTAHLRELAADLAPVPTRIETYLRAAELVRSQTMLVRTRAMVNAA